MNYLRPDVKRGNFTVEEEETIFKMHEMLGNKWSAMAAALSGRTDNDIKNHWHTHLKKRLPTQSSVSSGESKQKSVAESNLFLPNNVLESSMLGGNSAPTADFDVRNTENQDVEGDHGSETFEEALSLWEQPLSLDNNQDFQLEMFDDPGFIDPQYEFRWLDQPMSPYGFYNDLWLDPESLVSLSEQSLVGVGEPISIFNSTV